MVLDNGLVCVNLNNTNVDLSKIENRRFMFHPKGWLVLGEEDVCRGKLFKSHAEEYYEATKLHSLPAFDSFVRGWIGVGGGYPKGVVHFAPNIPSKDIELFDKAFSFVETVLKNGFSKDAVLRGFPGDWEQTIRKVIPDLESLEEKLVKATKRSEEFCNNSSSKEDFVKE